MLSATLVTGCAPDTVRYGIFRYRVLKDHADTHTVAPVAVCGEVYQQSAFSVNTYPVPPSFRT